MNIETLEKKLKKARVQTIFIILQEKEEKTNDYAWKEIRISGQYTF